MESSGAAPQGLSVFAQGIPYPTSKKETKALSRAASRLSAFVSFFQAAARRLKKLCTF
jgi:hypothetical protein